MRLLLLALAGCADAPPPLPPAPTTLGPATAVAAADLDGDGADEVLELSGPEVVWAGTPLGGEFQATARGDLDGDGDEEAVVAVGQGRTLRDAPARVWALHADRAELLWERSGPRNQVSDLTVVGGRVWVAAFSDRFTVTAGFLEGDSLEERPPQHMGMRQRPLGDGATLVGRLYGEEPRSDGDLRRVTASGVTPLPSLRGVRALAVGDLDGDGHPDAVVGDGWHSSYGKEGDPRVRLLRGPDLTDARTIGWLEGSYAVLGLEIVGEGPAARVVATGSHGAWVLTRDALGWRADRVADLSETGNAVAVRTPQGLAVATSGQPARLTPAPRP